jgi:hypothetical protein
MTFYVSKPLRMEAKQVTMGEIVRVADWCGGHVAYTGAGDAVGVLVPGKASSRPRLCPLGDYVTCDEHGEFGEIGAYELAAFYDHDRNLARA